MFNYGKTPPILFNLGPLLQELFWASSSEVQFAGFLEEAILTYMASKLSECRVWSWLKFSLKG